MTSEPTMHAPLCAHLRAFLALAIGLCCLITGCTTSGKLTPPTVNSAPYDTVAGQVLWAVAPLRNETGTSLLPAETVSDELIAAIQMSRGVACLPLNRTITAMRAMGITRIDTPEQAKELATAMGVDGLIIGSITAWDPYTPALGLSLAVYAMPGPMYEQQYAALDPRWLTPQPTEHGFTPGTTHTSGPASVVSSHFDARGHDTLLEVQRYAEGRTDYDAALGWQRYTKSMVLFTKFAAHAAVSELFREEWLRMARARVSRRAAG